MLHVSVRALGTTADTVSSRSSIKMVPFSWRLN
jgi:hypothetical protein